MHFAAAVPYALLWAALAAAVLVRASEAPALAAVLVPAVGAPAPAAVSAPEVEPFVPVDVPAPEVEVLVPVDAPALEAEAPAPAHATVAALPRGAPRSADVEPAVTLPSEPLELPLQVVWPVLAIAAAALRSDPEVQAPVPVGEPLRSVREPPAGAGLESPFVHSLLPDAAQMALWAASAFWWRLLADLRRLQQA